MLMKNKRAQRDILIFVLFLLIIFAPAMAEYEVFIKAESFSIDDAKKTSSMKNVVFLYKDIKITAGFATYNTITQIGDLKGSVKITQPGVVITGNRMKVFYKEKKSIITGAVKMVRNDPLKEQIVLTSQEIEYYWEKPVATATGNVKIVQKNRTAFCNKADYNIGAKLIHMTGGVRFQQGPVEWLTASEAFLDIEKNTFLAKGDIEGRFLVKENESQQEKNQKNLDEKLGDIDLEAITSEDIRVPLESEKQ